MLKAEINQQFISFIKIKKKTFLFLGLHKMVLLSDWIS